ncbi:pyridoxamine 5'-phosphate oxidase family protein [Nocardioides marmorisolisilvae]|uniref:pyridoxamine 5'-phosphate oxidase family protein n=1 Tax=Nocardioides marmorisolisilvae TaxID=1542737 RepID=UPI001C831DB5|nr:pyridoxamine 5'-phosphate oxidase family protein [Nocardioides marmorisolisilvae]
MTDDRTRIRRLPEKAATTRADLDAVLDAARVAHVAFVHDGAPVNIPTACARDGDRLLLHGSTGSRMMRVLATGVPVCVTLTLLDGMVLARSAFESSMHYRSAVICGSAAPVADQVPALRAMSEAWMPGRWDTLRPPTAKELAATLVLELPLEEWSVKISAGDPDDPPEDLDEPVWAGVLPIATAYGEPIPAPDLRGDPPLPDYLADWKP